MKILKNSAKCFIIFVIFLKVSETVSSQNILNDEYLQQKYLSNGLIYKIENASTSHTLLLIGSSHYGNEKLSILNTNLKNKLMQFCENYADESTTDEAIWSEDSQKQSQVPLVKSLLIDKTITDIHAIFVKKFGSSLSIFNAESIEKIKNLPVSSVALLLTGSIDIVGMPKSKGKSLDQVFKDTANLKNIKIENLETRLATLQHYKNFSNENYVIFVNALVNLYNNNYNQLLMSSHGVNAINHLLEGNANMVNQEFINSYSMGMGIQPEIIQNFFLDRDNHISDRIEFFLEKKNRYCISVGAAHLGGKNGLLNKLKAKKYIVTQILN